MVLKGEKDGIDTNIIKPLPSLTPPRTKLIRAKTRKGQRYLERRAPKLVRHSLVHQLAWLLACLPARQWL